LRGALAPQRGWSAPYSSAGRGPSSPMSSSPTGMALAGWFGRSEAGRGLASAFRLGKGYARGHEGGIAAADFWA